MLGPTQLGCPIKEMAEIPQTPPENPEDDSPRGFTQEEMAAQKIVARFRNARFRSKEEPKEGDSRVKLGEEGQDAVASFVGEIREKSRPLKEKAVKAGKEKAAQLIDSARERAPVWKEKVVEAAARFVLRTEEVMASGAKAMAPLLERGKKLWGKVREINPRETVGGLIDLPANFQEAVAVRAAKEAEQAKAKIKERIAAYKAQGAELQRGLDEKIRAKQEKLAAKLRSVEERYPPELIEMSEKAKGERDARRGQIQDEGKRFEEEQRSQMAEKRGGQKVRLDDDLELLRERLERKITSRDTWRLRAKEERDVADWINRNVLRLKREKPAELPKPAVPPIEPREGRPEPPAPEAPAVAEPAKSERQLAEEEVERQQLDWLGGKGRFGSIGPTSDRTSEHESSGKKKRVRAKKK